MWGRSEGTENEYGEEVRLWRSTYVRRPKWGRDDNTENITQEIGKGEK
jgi:hypothetical protein